MTKTKNRCVNHPSLNPTKRMTTYNLKKKTQLLNDFFPYMLRKHYSNDNDNNKTNKKPSKLYVYICDGTLSTLLLTDIVQHFVHRRHSCAVHVRLDLL